MARFKVTRVGKNDYIIYKKQLGVLWIKIASKPSWALAKQFLFDVLEESEFLYEDLWRVHMD